MWVPDTRQVHARQRSSTLLQVLSACTRLQVLLPHRPDVKLEGASVGRRWLVVNERKNAMQVPTLRASGSSLS